MLSRQNDPIVAIATAPGRGAIGVVRVSGKKLEPLIQALCGKKLRARQATHLPFRAADGAPIDRGLAIYFDGPHSFTGEDVLELQAHGGPIVLQMLLKRCLQAAKELSPETSCERLPGLRIAHPGEFTERAFLNDKIDLTQAEAIADLIDANTEAAAQSASRSLSGVFSKEIQALLQELVRLRMLVEATLDFPEEDIDYLKQADAQGQLNRLIDQTKKIQAQAKQGALLREGIRVVIAGQPNAGKSSLLNALAGKDLAIVTPVAGTTRDKIEQLIQIEGVPIHIIDTAGLRESVEEVEKIGIERAWGEIKVADVILFLHDLTRVKSTEYQKTESEIRDTLTQTLATNIPVLEVWNKLDAVTSDRKSEGIYISAKTADGVDKLQKELLRLAGWGSATEGVYMARERHCNALMRVSVALDAATSALNTKNPMLEILAEELRSAQNALDEITGKFSTEDLLGEIFSGFCIGK